MDNPAQFIRAARDFYGAGADHFTPGYSQYGDLLEAAEALAAPALLPVGDVREVDGVKPEALDDNSGSHLVGAMVSRESKILSLEKSVPEKAIEAAFRVVAGADAIVARWGRNDAPRV